MTALDNATPFPSCPLKDYGQTYVEILQVCRPFYSIQPVSATAFASLPARLEDGLEPANARPQKIVGVATTSSEASLQPWRESGNPQD